MKKKLAPLFLLLANTLFWVLFPSATISATVRYVRPTATGTGTGDSWANASANLQAMINASALGDEVWVAEGTYKPAVDVFGNASPTDPREKTFYIKDGVNVYGGFLPTGTPTFASRAPTTNITKLSADIDNDGIWNNTNAYHVVVCVDNTQATTLDGFTLMGGFANEPGKSVRINPSNSASTQIHFNSGGGIFFNACSIAPVINNCTFEKNQADFGGAVVLIHSAGVLTNCTLVDNKAVTYGGGLGIYYATTPVVSPVISNCTFVNNACDNSGGAIEIFSNATSITNCTFFNNGASSGAAFHATGGAGTESVFKNCILWGTTHLQTIVTGATQPTITYSVVQGGYSGTGNITTDPLYFNTANLIGADNKWRTADDGITLGQCSPAVNIGNNTGVSTVDITGATRVQQTTIDLGAYESPLANMVAPTTSSASAVASTSSTLNATVNPNGVAATVSFEYGTSNSAAALTSSTPNQAFSGSSDQLVSAVISGLASGSTYYYRVKMVHPCGTFYGTIQTLTTSSACASSSTPISTTSETTTRNVTSSFFGNTGCSNLIAKIVPSGANQVSGNVTAAVFVESSVIVSGISPYLAVKRHYEVTPITSDPVTATATLTLYFTQAEFTSFNSHASSVVDLPTGTSDATGKGNLRIFKFAGTSSGGYLPASYSGGLSVIDPVDANILWDATNNRWEITFDVAGFSGFFLGTSSSVLGLELTSFEGHELSKQAHTEGVQNNLNWATAAEINFKNFEVQRLAKDKTFQSIGIVANTDATHRASTAATYQFIDEKPLNQVNYYRLKINDNDGTSTLSKVISIENQGTAKSINSVRVYPNPVAYILTVEQPTAATIDIINAVGQVVYKSTNSATRIDVNVSNLPSGVYFVQMGEQRTKFIKM